MTNKDKHLLNKCVGELMDSDTVINFPDNDFYNNLANEIQDYFYEHNDEIRKDMGWNK